ncbi:hypothetical protein HFK18_12875|nr:hypothetical protein [Stenotrophomonas sp. SbOxS2]
MARRKQSAAGWIVGVLVVIWLIPKEILIGLGIATLIGLVLWIWLRWRTEKKEAPAIAPLSEPTLAELIQSSALKAVPKVPIRRPTSIRDEAAIAPVGSSKGSGLPALHSAGLGGSVSQVPGPVSHRSAAGGPSTIEMALSPPDAGTSPGVLTSAALAMADEHDLGPDFSVSQLEPSNLNLETSTHSAPRKKAGNLAEAMKAVAERSAAGKAAQTFTEQVQVQIPGAADVAQRLAAALTAHGAQATGASRPGNLKEVKARIAEHGASYTDPTQVETELRTSADDDRGPSQGQQAPPAIPRAVPPPLPSATGPATGMEELHRVVIASDTPLKEFTVPLPPEGWAKTRWLGADETVEIGGVAIRGGLFYTGVKLDSPNGDTEPSLVNSVLAVAPYGDYRGSTNYWLAYAQLSPSERRAYLTWLASDRTDSNCSISYVRLYFFGLERRVLLDSVTDPESRKDWPAIKQALRKLGSAYGEIYGPIRGYTNSLLDWMELDSVEEKLYSKPIPPFDRSYELPFYVRLALGQCSLDRAPVPAPLALAWIRLNPEVSLRTAAVRCADEFDRLFVERYHELFGSGMVLPKNRTKLKFARQPASPALYGASLKPKTFGDVPDVTALRAPLKGLLELVQQCTDELGPYSRLVGRSSDSKDSLEALLLLPPTIWPESQRNILRSIAEDVQAGNMTIQLTELSARLGPSLGPLGRERVRDLARVLESVNVGMEPNVLEGARAPSEADPIVIFALLPGQSHKTDAAAYQTAILTLQLASAVAQSDGSFSAQELAHLSLEIDGWSHLSVADHGRLRAHLDLLAASPIALPSLRKKLDPLDSATKEAIAASMATLAQVDGMVSPEEVRFLEKVYKALGVEPKRVFSDIHAPRSAKTQPQSTQSAAFQLDPERIAALQRDTAKVSALLANIFTEDEPNSSHEDALSSSVEEKPVVSNGLLGLDECHSALLRLMLSRPSWTRAELEDGAADLELMLDGALEQINDASFDAYDIPFSDGDDPLEVNPEFFEKIEQ